MKRKSRLKLRRETVHVLNSEVDLRQVAGGTLFGCVTELACPTAGGCSNDLSCPTECATQGTTCQSIACPP